MTDARSGPLEHSAPVPDPPVPDSPEPDSCEAEIAARLRGAGCVFAEDEARLLRSEAESAAELATMVDRRTWGHPLEQILGWVAFHGRRFVVRPGVFVPRRRSELLVRQAAGLAVPGAVVVDLCCGSGAIGAAVLAELPGAKLHAVDLDPAAVRCAHHNLPAEAVVHQGDLDEPLPTGLRDHVDLLICNAPYVPTDAINLLPPEAREHEPSLALDGGPDGLAVHRRVAAKALRWLAPGGHLLVETSESQAARARDDFARCGLAARVTSDEELGATVVIGTRVS